MRAGLQHTEAGSPPYESDEVRMLFLDGRDDMAKWAEEQPLEAEPGAKFEYSSSTTVILADGWKPEGNDTRGPHLRHGLAAGPCRALAGHQSPTCDRCPTHCGH